MTEIRHDFRVDVMAALPPGVAEEPVEIAATVVVTIRQAKIDN